MALSVIQKIRLVLRIWIRRRSESSDRRRRAFLERETSWGGSVESTPAPVEAAVIEGIDIDGLQVAFLDESGQFAYFLDRETGEVLEQRVNEASSSESHDSDRVRRVPVRGAEAEAGDREAFLDGLESSVAASIRKACLSDDHGEFRRAISKERKIERAWYNFRNDRALVAIEGWLRTLDADE